MVWKQWRQEKLYSINLERKMEDLSRSIGGRKFGNRMQWSAKLLVAQLCPTLCDPMDCSLPGSSVHGILQAKILECVVISYSRGSPQPRDLTHNSCVSCTGRRILYHCATSEDWTLPYNLLNQGRLAKVWQKLKQLGRSIIIDHQCHIISSRIE